MGGETDRGAAGGDDSSDADAANDAGAANEGGAGDVDVVVVVALAENGVIGADGELPWHHPADLRHFKETTMGHPVVMGRRTYESIVERLGEPLPGRTSVVLSSRDLDLPSDAVRAPDLETALETARAAAEERCVGAAYVAGGETVYEQVLPRTDRLVVTEVPGEPEGDAYFPALDPARWRETARRTEGDLAFVEYERSR